ncbi:MAG: hypothetical protein A2V88_02765 [Elusimicrobia bacterium RBG_16_66_12]|nr:MAG: hypothetical protein A2V88_02765 [Elusimicrobia bacterium RBG_16_66_12]
MDSYDAMAREWLDGLTDSDFRETPDGGRLVYAPDLAALLRSVAEQEREACAKVAAEMAATLAHKSIAAAIRARAEGATG